VPRLTAQQSFTNARSNELDLAADGVKEARRGIPPVQCSHRPLARIDGPVGTLDQMALEQEREQPSEPRRRGAQRSLQR
jgi:hypothetical protein